LKLKQVKYSSDMKDLGSELSNLFSTPI